MGSFTRTFRLIERLFPGNTEIPATVGTFVQPAWNVLALKVGESLLRAQRLTGPLAGVPPIILLTTVGPTPGRAHIPAVISVLTGGGAARANLVMLVTAGVAPDPWGAWPSIQIETRALAAGGSIAETTRFVPELPFVVSGNAYAVAVSGGVAGDAITVDYAYYDVPAELVEVQRL